MPSRAGHRHLADTIVFTFFPLYYPLVATSIMDRIVIPCKHCGRPLVALPAMKTRKCAACGATTKVLAFQREQAAPIADVAGKVAAKAKKPQLDPGKTVIVKRRAARTIIDEEGDE
ncbi:MAG: hypothetical protein Q6373_008045 [Candidatus Sigynarchaeota archaeon]